MVRSSARNSASTPKSAKSKKQQQNQNESVVNSTEMEMEDLKTKLELQGVTMLTMERHIINLESRIAQLEGNTSITSHVNDILAQEIDNLQQYQRRSHPGWHLCS